jgi:hypothetical protein
MSRYAATVGDLARSHTPGGSSTAAEDGADDGSVAAPEPSSTDA